MPPRSLDGLRPTPRYAEPQRPAAAPMSPPVTPPSERPRVRAPYRAILLYSVIGSYLYLIVSPVLPRFTLGTAQHSDNLSTPPPTPVVMANVPALTAATPTPVPIPGPNRLTLAAAGVNGQVYEGDTEKTLDKGIWHIPGTSTPDKGGNTVLAAHRYMFLTGGDTFYNLDKVKVGDRFSIVWSGRMYTYETYETKVVTDRAVDINDNTAEPIVTLYTCTPLWTSKDRLVVRGRLVAN